MTMVTENPSQFGDTFTKIAFWYLFSVIAPVTNKWVQEEFDYTNTLSILLLATASVIGGLLCLRQAKKGLFPFFRL